MLNTRFRPSFGALLVGAILIASSVSAQDEGVTFSVLGTHIDDNPDKFYEDDTGATLGLGTIIGSKWNLEGTLQKLDPAGPGAQVQRSAGLDFQRVFRRDRRFSPYLLMGLGVLETTLESGPSDDSPMYSAGVGFLADIFGSSRVALRAEYRYREDRAFSTSGDDGLFSLGLYVPFGGRPAPVVDADRDGDGVPDSRDQCPATPRGVAVDANGCEPPPPPAPVVDSDGDGVPDGVDRCPNTIGGARVDAAGCELDADGDGIVDRLDRCANTTAGVQVDVYGCEIREEITLPGVNFETNSDRLLPSAVAVLEDATQTLRNNPTLTVEIQGHTDSDGAAEYNQNLSERRALAVREFFLARGIAQTRLTARGYGESNPIAANSTADGKARNRRVVLRVLSR